MSTNSKPKARLMWANSQYLDPKDELPVVCWNDPNEKYASVAVLDLSDPDALVERVARDLCKLDGWKSKNVDHYFPKYEVRARAALRALGVPTSSKSKSRKAK